MNEIRFRWAGIDVEYIDGVVTCTCDGVPQGVYSMGVTMITGSTILGADLRRAIHGEIERTLANARALADARNA
jgi:hypothetical protein